MKTRTLSRTCLILPIVLSGPIAFACLWDSDTRSMEEREFPGTLALITGGFLRHSPEFYEWRIEHRLAEIEKRPDHLGLYDDLAVAYEKAGDTAQAIEIGEEMLNRDPERYETLANLGTFYIHNGELERGVEFIDKAIEINPDAHFGRERYQKLVVEYVLTKRAGGDLILPLHADPHHGSGVYGFTEYLFNRMSKSKDKAKKQEVKDAIKGIQGMMRFGNHDSPILLECLGDLLVFGDRTEGALQLAARAYLKASFEAETEAAREKYHSLAQSAAGGIYSRKEDGPLEFPEFQKRFEAELEEADTWSQDVFADERRWIAEGVNVEERYAEKYYGAPPPLPDPEAAYSGNKPYAPNETFDLIESYLPFIVVGIVVSFIIAICIIAVVARRYLGDRSATSKANPN